MKFVMEIHNFQSYKYFFLQQFHNLTFWLKAENLSVFFFPLNIHHINSNQLVPLCEHTTDIKCVTIFAQVHKSVTKHSAV